MDSKLVVGMVGGNDDRSRYVGRGLVVDCGTGRGVVVGGGGGAELGSKGPAGRSGNTGGKVDMAEKRASKSQEDGDASGGRLLVVGTGVGSCEGKTNAVEYGLLLGRAELGGGSVAGEAIEVGAAGCPA